MATQNAELEALRKVRPLLGVQALNPKPKP